MNTDMAMALRRPFPAEQIGTLPRSGIKLEYVGHADVTSRLLEADPNWTWEPLATDERGLPAFDLDPQDRPVGLWIRLTVGDVTRLGYGSCPSNQGDAIKVLIGDALRNAAMRFGVAVDLWAKGDRADPTAENPSGAAGHARRQPEATDITRARLELVQAAKETGHGSDPQTIGAIFTERTGMEVKNATVDDIKVFIATLREDYAKEHGGAAA